MHGTIKIQCLSDNMFPPDQTSTTLSFFLCSSSRVYPNPKTNIFAHEKVFGWDFFFRSEPGSFPYFSGCKLAEFVSGHYLTNHGIRRCFGGLRLPLQAEGPYEPGDEVGVVSKNSQRWRFFGSSKMGSSSHTHTHTGTDNRDLLSMIVRLFLPTIRPFSVDIDILRPFHPFFSRCRAIFACMTGVSSLQG